MRMRAYIAKIDWQVKYINPLKNLMAIGLFKIVWLLLWRKKSIQDTLYQLPIKNLHFISNR